MFNRLAARSSNVWVGLQPLQDALQPKVLVSSVSAGFLAGVIGTIRAISYASLIFSGALAVHLPTGLGMTVFSTAVSLAVVALTSTMPGMIATPLTAPAAILGMMAAAIASELQGEPAEAVLATILLMVVTGSLLTAGLLLGLGIFKQGDRIRVIPYPVIGGFMAGTGWLLTRGFIQVTADMPLSWSSLGALMEPAALWCWLPGLGFAIALFTATRLWQQFWVMPATLLACVSLFFLLLWGSGSSLVAAREAGWLLGPFPQGDQLWQPLTLQQVSQVHWLAIVHQGGGLLTLMLVSLLSLMLSNSSIELVIGRDLSLNEEIKSIGLANLLSGLGGGMVGNQALPSTLLVNNMGATYRLSGLFAVVPSVAVLVLGSSFLSYLPKALMGSVILYLGLSLLWKWLYEAYFKIPLWDYVTVWVTLIVINTVGFLAGILTGFLLTVIYFMYRYSQVDVAAQVFSGATTRSNVERSAEADRILSQAGDQIYMLELQGFLFFGTANYLLSKVRDRISQSKAQSKTQSKTQSKDSETATERSPALRYVLIDFRQVSGLDSSAVLTFDKILKLARQQDFHLVLTNLLPELQQELKRGLRLELKPSHSPDSQQESLPSSELGSQPSSEPGSQPDRCHMAVDIDRGLEWCEQQILSAVKSSNLQPDFAEPIFTGITEQLADLFLSEQQAQRFVSYLKPQSLPTGYYIFRKGDPQTGLYFIESGQVSVLLEQANGQNKRLQTCVSGHILGEMRFYSKSPLSTTVVTDMPSQLYCLSKENFEQMQQESPDLAQALQAHIVKILCDSLLRREQQLRVMQ
ncbi:MAG: SulP family inorganic anion transporter [Phormidesmis sp.]